MNTGLAVELVGYLGSALVVVSMLMTSVVRLRVVNTVGSVIFMTYALIIGSYPTAAMNLFLIGINIYHLVRLFRDRKEYDLIETELDDGFVSYCLDKWHDDILRWFPEFAPAPDADVVLFACCGGNPASLLIGRRARKDGVEILLDYAAPVYRDTSAGRFLYEQLKKRGFRTVTFRGHAPDHVPYMEKIGYRRDGDAFVLDLDKM